METINHDQLENMIRRCYENQFPLFVYGGFGIGKSQTERKVAHNLSDDREYVEWNRISYEKKEEVIENAGEYFVNKDIRLAQMDPSDIHGIPDIGGDRKYLKWNPPSWAIWSSQPEAEGFLFFDEANLASPAVMKAFYQIIHDREIGDINISDGVGIMSAGNRQKDNAGVNAMPKPLQDRYFEVELKTPTKEQWKEWAIDNGIDSFIISYLEMNRGHLYKPREVQSKLKPATPRGWEQISDMLAPIDPRPDTEYLNFIQTSVASRLGEDIATEFVGFMENSRRINIDDYINNPKNEPIPEESDLKWTLISGITNWYRGLEDEKKIDKGLEVSMNVVNNFEHNDYAMNLAHQIKSVDEEPFKENVGQTSVWKGELRDKVQNFLFGDFE